MTDTTHRVGDDDGQGRDWHEDYGVNTAEDAQAMYGAAAPDEPRDLNVLLSDAPDLCPYCFGTNAKHVPGCHVVPAAPDEPPPICMFAAPWLPGCP